MDIKIGDKFYHPCSVDIMEHEVKEIRFLGGGNQIQYVLKATHNIGSCGRVEVLISENKGRFVFLEILNESEYHRGLQDFVEGYYFPCRKEARKEFYRVQRTIAYTNMSRKEVAYKEARDRYEQIKRIITELSK